MVFKTSGARTFSPPPGLPAVETPPPEADTRTTRQIMLSIEGKLDGLIDALADLEESDDEAEGTTLDGEPAGKPRDQTQSLG